MKNLLTACLPALALFALGGCAGTSALTSSEDDGVYYSSQDRTTAIVSAAPAPASTDEAANPDYNGNQSSSTARQGSGSDQYYDNTYTYMRGAPGYGAPLTYYTPYSPYTSLSYGIGTYGYGGFSPFGYGSIYDPFYSPFYSPFGYGYGSGISISFGFGRPWGYGGYGYSRFGYASPFYGGYGYNSFYDPYYYGGPFYGGYYGRGGYYGNAYYGSTYRGSGVGGSYDNGRYRAPSHRTDRASDGRYSTGGGVVSVPGATSGSPASGGRGRTSERIMANPGTTSQPMPTATEFEGRRERTQVLTASPETLPTRSEGSFNQPQAIDGGRPRYRNMDQAPAAGQPMLEASPNQGQLTRDEGRGRWRNADVATPQSGQMQPSATPQPQEGQRRRGGFFQNILTEPSNANAGQAADQPTRQRSYDQPARQRTYEQPQRTFEQPQRTFEQPQRSYSPAPSYGGGGGGGGNSGGGGGGGGRSRD